MAGMFRHAPGLTILLLLCAAQPLRAQTAVAAAAETPDARRARLLYIQCRACHELKAGMPHKVGPNLHGVIGRKAGSFADFSYSAAMRAANLVWDAATLDKWIERPSTVVPGNSMAFAGVANPKDRALLIAYLTAESAP